MHTHATVQAIRRLCGLGPRTSELDAAHWKCIDDGLWERMRLSCDWTLAHSDSTVVMFRRQHAWKMISGEKVEFPTCPTCLMFIDLALLESGLTCGENVEAA